MKPIQMSLLAALLCLGCTPAAESQAAPPVQSIQQTQAKGKNMQITIGKYRFAADLVNTAAATELRALLPLTLNMADHLGNEKHAELPRTLSRNARRPGRIQAGDIMLWQGNTLVVFYESFDSAYSYTRLGKIRDVKNLKAAVGRDHIEMRFGME